MSLHVFLQLRVAYTMQTLLIPSRPVFVLVIHGWTAPFGNVQVIQKPPHGVLRTGTELRREPAAMAY